MGECKEKKNRIIEMKRKKGRDQNPNRSLHS